jgi:hypothetical protein
MPNVMSEREPSRSEIRPATGANRTTRERQGEERRTGLDGRVAEDVLHVERDEEKDPEHRQGHEQDDHVRPRERAAPEERQVEHGQPLMQLEQDEGRKRHGGDRESADDAGGSALARMRYA